MSSDFSKTADSPGVPGTWTALENSVFRNFWLFSFFAFVGASMQTISAGWLMTELDPAPGRVAMIQAAYSLSAFAMGLPAGVLADLVDRRWIMLLSLAGLMLVGGLLGVVTLNGIMGPNLLIALTFMFGIAAAMLSPAMQATTPDLVPREQLPSALTLNGMNISIARAVGPGLAGLILGAWGAGWAFILSLASFVGLFAVIMLWRNRPPQPARQLHRFPSALREGVIFVAGTAPLRRLLSKAALNFLMISIFLALVPSVADKLLDGRPQTLGLLMASFGIGSVSGSLLLSRLYRYFSRGRVIDMATATHGIAVLIIGFSADRYLSAGAAFLAGISWTAIMTSVNIIAQLLLPAPFRARGLSINLMAMMGALALGSGIWGQIAQAQGLREAFLVAGIFGVLTPVLTSRIRLVEELGDNPVALAKARTAKDKSR
jgi:MFS family permease